MSFAQHATTMFFPHFVGDACSRQSHQLRKWRFDYCQYNVIATPRCGPKCPIRTPEMAGLVGTGWAELGSPMSSTRKPGEKAMTFVRYLVAICIGIAGTLAWQSYGEATKQIIATTAPELGWSPEAKQTIASWVQQLGWTKSPAGSEKQGAPVAQTAPTTSFLDPEKVQQIAQNLVAVREAVEQLAAGQDQTKREIVRMESSLIDMLVKIPEPPPPVAPARKPTPTPPPMSSRAPTTAPHP